MSGDDETQEQTIADDLVVTKFKMGSDIANRKLKSDRRFYYLVKSDGSSLS